MYTRCKLKRLDAPHYTNLFQTPVICGGSSIHQRDLCAEYSTVGAARQPMREEALSLSCPLIGLRWQLCCGCVSEAEGRAHSSRNVLLSVVWLTMCSRVIVKWLISYWSASDAAVPVHTGRNNVRKKSLKITSNPDKKHRPEDWINMQDHARSSIYLNLCKPMVTSE